MRRTRALSYQVATLVTAPTLLGAILAAAPAQPSTEPTLVGRAVLPVETYAPGPPAGNFVTGSPGVITGIEFPLPRQPVEGFSAIVKGRRPGEYLAMADNGFGSKANSPDFLIRAYFIRPEFESAHGGSGTVKVGRFISFSDPRHLLGFPIVNEATHRRLLTGADIDPESLQRGRNGEFWVGDEFGPWILHFGPGGRLLDPPFDVGLKSPSNPFLGTETATQPNSRGFEGIAITPDRRYLYAALEGATVADPDQSRRLIYELGTRDEGLTGRTWQYRTEDPTYMVADMWALDRYRFVVIERDAGRGLAAVFRKVYRIDLRQVDPSGFLHKTELVDLAMIPDPHLISLPPIHEGDVGLGNPYRVTCESVEAIQVLGEHRLLIGCDNNFPNSGRNPDLADDTELIVVNVPGLRSRTS